MNPKSAAHISVPALLLLVIMICNTLLVPAVAVKYSYDTFSAAASGFGFLILLVLTGWLGFRVVRGASRQKPMRSGPGISVGLFLGLLWVIEIGINNFIAPPLPARDTMDNIFWGVIALMIFISALFAAKRTGRIWAGIEAGAWSGFVSGAVACWMALSLIVFGMKFILQDPLNVAEWAERGLASSASSMASYFAYQTFAGAFLHLTVLGILMGTLLGLLGGGFGKVLNRLAHQRDITGR
jgi:hypothetical protein